ncbi:Ger(x)C family spore germination protein [Paenibacillus sp. TAB 01]|uniref:Ger(x)C family spore germination protein n=1 Tax=Paenibacillus sp. TAB 01 TaxID=3368988 RepID=UPI0037506EA3
MRHRRLVLVLLITVSLLLLPGCRDRIDLEDITLTLSLGIDLDEDNQLLFYSSSPVFSKEATKKTEEYGVKSATLRYSREEFDAVTTALTSKGKVQVFLLGKKVVEHPDWFSMLDVMFRDAKSTLNAKVAVVDGPVSKFINYYPKDKPRLPLHMTKLIDTADRRNLTVKTSLATLHTQFYEKGMTPAVTELKMENSLEVAGTALLDRRGRYVDTLLLQETELLRILQDNKQGQLSLTLPVPGVKDNWFHRNRISYYVENIHRSIKTGFKDGRFRFQMIFKVSALQTERLFPYDMRKDEGKLRQALEQQLGQDLRDLVKRLQQIKLDPIGLGMYARAHEYDTWKRVQDQWGKAFAEADIDVQVHLKTLNMGLIR